MFFSLFSIVLRRFTTPFNIDDKRTNKERSVSSSSSSQDSGDVVSTSEDAVYSEKFDLTNNSLRDHYAKLKTSSEKPIVEVETVTNKDSSKMTTTGLRKDGKVSRSVSGTTTCDVDLEAVEGNNGRTFKDFGGIKTVLDKLETDVLFPLLNPRPFDKMNVKLRTGLRLLMLL